MMKMVLLWRIFLVMALCRVLWTVVLVKVVFLGMEGFERMTVAGVFLDLVFGVDADLLAFVCCFFGVLAGAVVLFDEGFMLVVSLLFLVSMVMTVFILMLLVPLGTRIFVRMFLLMVLTFIVVLLVLILVIILLEEMVLFFFFSHLESVPFFMVGDRVGMRILMDI